MIGTSAIYLTGKVSWLLKGWTIFVTFMLGLEMTERSALHLLAQAAVIPPCAPIDFSPMTIAALAGGIVLIIGALFGGVGSLITIARTVGTTAKDTEAIKGHVNSERTAMEGRELTLRAQVTLLREMLTDQKVIAERLASAAQTISLAHAIVPSPGTTVLVAPDAAPLGDPAAAVPPSPPDTQKGSPR